jgi:hypothetical protein
LILNRYLEHVWLIEAIITENNFMLLKQKVLADALMPLSSITVYIRVWQAIEAQLQDGNVRFC